MYTYGFFSNINFSNRKLCRHTFWVLQLLLTSSMYLLVFLIIVYMLETLAETVPSWNISILYLIYYMELSRKIFNNFSITNLYLKNITTRVRTFKFFRMLEYFFYLFRIKHGILKRKTALSFPNNSYFCFIYIHISTNFVEFKDFICML